MFTIEAAGDGGGTHASGGITLEDAPDDWRGALVRDKLLALVAGIAEGDAPVRPAAFPCAALDTAGHTVNNRGVLKLREHTKHLKHHPPRRGAGVEWPGSGAQDHAEVIEFLGDPGELAHLAGQAVDV